MMKKQNEIHIKPSHRGKLTELKKRTGKSEAELYNDGNPAHKKMVVFARNSRKWHHADGGNLFAYGSPIHIRDYGMEWNNKLDRLSAYNNLISQLGQKAGSISSGAGGFGGTSEGSAGWGNVGKTPRGLTGNDAIASQSFAANEFGFACGGKLKSCEGKLHKYGGNLFDYGGDFTNGQTLFDAGGTHEENPYEGVQIGTDDEGVPNLVEEGEVQYKDYIFSNRLALTPELCEKYTIPAKFADKTFAYIADKMGDESEERPADPISKRTLEANMERLRNAQEEVRALKEQQEAEKQIEETAEELGITPEEVVEGVQLKQQAEEAAAQQEAMAQQQAMQQQQMVMPQEQQIPQDENAMIEGLPYADGGILLRDNPPGTQRDNTRVANAGVTYKQLEENAPYMLKKAINDEKDRYHAEGLALDWERAFHPEKPIPPFYEDEIWLGNYTKHKKNLDSIKRVYSFPPEFSQSAPKKNAYGGTLFENAPFALGGTLFDYQGMDYSNPQRTKTLGNNYPRVFMAVNKYGGGGNTNNDGRPKGYIPRNQRSKDYEVKPVYDGEVFEEIADGVLRHHWYRKPEGGYAPELVVAKPSKSTKKGKGVKKAAKPTIAQQLSNTPNNTTSTIDNDAIVEAAMAERNSELQNGTKEPSEYESYHSYEPTGEHNPKDTTTQQENLDINKRRRVMPNYSILDFVPLWQYLTAGKPDYTQPDALVNYTNRIPRLSPKYIGDYMQYHPFDRQYAANQLRAQTAAAMRNNINMSAGNRGYATAANLAANMQAQLADANMQRQADEANLNQRYTVTNFNRGTNQFNAQAYNNMAVADANLRYPLGLQARSGRMQGHYMIDRDFGQSQSTNLNTWMQNMYNRRREADEKNMINWAAKNKVFGNLGDSYPYDDGSLLGAFLDYLRNRKTNNNNNSTVSG